jgi:ribonuclease HI
MLLLSISGPSTLGAGTNNRVELMGVWATLFLEIRLHITGLQIIGDSKLIIDWCNGIGSLQSLALEGWKDQIKKLSTLFEKVSYNHAYRDFNKEADVLSKKALRDQNQKDRLSTLSGKITSKDLLGA